MKIALVMHPFGERESSGLGRMAFALAQALIEGHPEHEFILITKYPTQSRLLFKGNNWKVHSSRGGRFWLGRAVRSAPPADAYVFSTPILPLFSAPRRSIVFAHDFAYLYPLGGASFLRRVFLKFMQGYAFRRAAKIIAVSQYTRDEIINFFAVAPEKVTVVYNGIINPALVQPEPVEDVPVPYFLYAGGMKERKNVGALIKAFALFNKTTEFPGVLVLTGGKNGAYARSIAALAQEEGVSEKIRLVGVVSNEQLSYLFQHAFAFVFPSQLEGFGMAAVEAMAAGLPVIAAGSSGLKEAVGDAALCVDPNNTEEFSNAIKRVWSDTQLRQDLRARSLTRSQEFSWQKAAQETLKVIGEL